MEAVVAVATTAMAWHGMASNRIWCVCVYKRWKNSAHKIAGKSISTTFPLFNQPTTWTQSIKSICRPYRIESSALAPNSLAHFCTYSLVWPVPMYFDSIGGSLFLPVPLLRYLAWYYWTLVHKLCMHDMDKTFYIVKNVSKVSNVMLG